jgi:hypothetical protein
MQIRKPSKLSPITTVSFGMKKTPSTGYYKDRTIHSNRELAVIIPGAGVMERNELREYTHYIRETLGRDDITEDEVLRLLEEKAKEAEIVSIKPYIRKRMMQKARGRV